MFDPMAEGKSWSPSVRGIPDIAACILAQLTQVQGGVPLERAVGERGCGARHVAALGTTIMETRRHSIVPALLAGGYRPDA
jgi:hypothetical protein